MTDHPENSHSEPPKEESIKIDLGNIISALSLLATLFFGGAAYEHEDQTSSIDPEQNISQQCESFYNDMDALNDAGLSVEGLAQIEDPRESVCGPAHTVPYVWDVPSQVDNESPEGTQSDGEILDPNEQ